MFIWKFCFAQFLSSAVNSKRFTLFPSYLYQKDERALPGYLQNIKRVLPPPLPKKNKLNCLPLHLLPSRLSFFLSVSVRVLKCRSTFETISRRPSFPRRIGSCPHQSDLWGTKGTGTGFRPPTSVSSHISTIAPMFHDHLYLNTYNYVGVLIIL